MNQFEAADEIAKEFPEIQAEINQYKFENPFKIVDVITNYTRKMIDQHNEFMVERCIKLVGKIYSLGNQKIKDAIESEFIFSLSNIVSSCSFSERKSILTKIPPALQIIYNKQVYKSGI